MDKEDGGCRYEFFRIIKSIIRGEVIFVKLISYYLKIVFLRYNINVKVLWDKDMFGERFIEYLELFYVVVNSKILDYFWIEGVNFLENVFGKILENMVCRLRRILDSDKERNKVFKCNSKCFFDWFLFLLFFICEIILGFNI